MQLFNKNPLFLISLLVSIVYFFTGVTALSYEVLWARMLSTIFGVSIFGVVVTISAFMAGLGAGSFYGGRIQSRINQPLLVFGLIEFFVALFAFNLPVIFSSLDVSIQTLTAGSGYYVWIAAQAMVTFFLMFLPAFGLGFGFPLVVKSTSVNNIPLGFVYSLNTLGGVIGALLPLFLLPVFGWVVSDRLIAVFGFLLSATLLLLAFLFRHQKYSLVKEKEAEKHHPNKLLLTNYALIGASAIMLEIGWTRLYGMILLRTEYVMAIILATFLLGIGLGSLVVSRSHSQNWLFLLPVLIVLSALASLFFLPSVSSWAESVAYTSLFSSMWQQAAVIALFTLPATLAFGAWLPLLVAQHKNTCESGAYLYGANSIGGAIGGVVAGFILIPLLGTPAVIAIAAFIVLLVSTHWIRAKWYKAVPFISLLFFIPLLSFPSVKDLLPVSQKNAIDLQVYEDALTVTHVVEDSEGQRLLLADLQRMDASTAPDAITVQKNQSRLPLLLHPEPKSILFLGLGTGITASGSLPYPDLKRTAVELSQGAIDAASTWFADSNLHIVDKLLVVKDDARRFLKSTNHKYDVIIGDLFHPDLIGRSNLLSLQQFLRAKSRLTDNGIFVQWIALNQFDVDTLKVVFSTFNKSFSNAYLFVDGFRVALVGFNSAFGGFNSVNRNIQKLNSAGVEEITGGEGVWTWLGRYWGPVPSQKNWGIQDEWAPKIEFQLPQAKFNRQIDLGKLLAFLHSIRSPGDEALNELHVPESGKSSFKKAYQATNDYYSSWQAYFSGRSLESQKFLANAYALNPKDQWIGFGMADALYSSIDQAVKNGIPEKKALDRILGIRPDHIPALKRRLAIADKEKDEITSKKLKESIVKISPLDKTTLD